MLQLQENLQKLQLRKFQLQKLQLQKNVLQHYSILLFGETGSGKSTLINYLTNYFLGGSLGNLKIAIETPYLKATEGWKSNEKDINDTKKSKTSDCTVYDFTKAGVRYNFIDTPGLSDTKGTGKDNQHIDKMVSFVQKTGRLSCIIIVINGTTARARKNVTNTLVRLKGSVPDVVLNNLVVVLTKCNLVSAKFDLDSLKTWTVPEINTFHMDNSALRKPVKDWVDNEKLKKIISNQWQASMEEIGGMINRINQLGHIASNAFREMRLKREQIIAELHGMMLDLDKLGALMIEVKWAAGHVGGSPCLGCAAGLHGIDFRYSNYKQTKQLEYKELEPADYHNTICSVPWCSKVCHGNCGLDYTSNLASDMFTICGVGFFSNLNCKTCGCPYAHHYHAMKKLVKKSKTIEDMLHDVKALYDHHTNKETDASRDEDAMQQALDRKQHIYDEYCRQLDTIDSQFNYEAELQSVVNTMKLRCETISQIENMTSTSALCDFIESQMGSCASETDEDATPATQDKPATVESHKPPAKPESIIPKMTTPQGRNRKILQDGKNIAWYNCATK